MVQSFALLLICQLIGEAASRGLALPVPGPVLGLVLLLVGLQLLAQQDGSMMVRIDETDLGRTAGGLLQSLALIFVPAGAGVVQHLGLLGQHGLGLALAVLGSTVLTLLVTVLVFSWFGRALGSTEDGAEP